MFGGLEMVGFVFGSDSLVADGPEMFSFVWESGCCSAGGAGDGLVMVELHGNPVGAVLVMVL